MAEQGEAGRLKFLYELSRGLTSFTDLDSLLGFVVNHLRNVFEAEGVALLLHDRATKEFYFSNTSEASLGSTERLNQVRFPDDRGVAGWVFANDKSVAVADASKDPRFYSGVDQRTQMTTQSLAAAPLRTRTGNIGVLEIVNLPQKFLGDADLEFLEAIAGDVAAAIEKAHLYDQLRGEVHGLRQGLRSSGFVLGGAGVLFLIGAAIRQVAWAMPLAEMLGRPAFWLGMAGVGIGVFLIRASGRGKPAAIRLS